MRRFFALLLCGLVLLSTGCAYAAVSSQRGEGDYELFSGKQISPVFPGAMRCARRSSIWRKSSARTRRR